MSQDPRLEPALAAIWPDRQAVVTPIEGGITNLNYRIDVDQEAFVLRLAGTDTELLGIDRAAEVEACRVAAEAGVGPEVVAFEPDLGCIVTRFVSGSPIPENELGHEAVMRSVVASIRAIHGSRPIRATFPVFRIVEEFRDIAAERGVEVPAEYDDAHAVAGRIEGSFAAAPAPLTTCHNDLLNANFLLEGDHTWIVDYEYAGMGDPFFDLGNLSINNDLDEDAQALLLRMYFGDVRDVHRARLALMRIVSDLREAMWGVVQQAISTLDFDYVGYADRHFARLLANAGDPRLDGWLDAAGATV
ncbi:MAG: hypothetical protein E6G37_06485 [Actinobacteria bacterium]|nr:MAG: hypothetical protein E6G37_06485 [Actinomycetota bacterium]TMM21675.1 MAG: hypothetical protein E6F95_10530 [Actinomycetota bacterium]